MFLVSDMLKFRCIKCRWCYYRLSLKKSTSIYSTDSLVDTFTNAICPMHMIEINCLILKMMWVFFLWINSELLSFINIIYIIQANFPLNYYLWLTKFIFMFRPQKKNYFYSLIFVSLCFLSCENDITKITLRNTIYFFRR